MISQCSICDEPYSTKYFVEAKKRVCPACAKKSNNPISQPPNHPLVADGRMPVPVAAERIKPVEHPKSSGMAGAFIPKPDDGFNQRPLVWAK